jgi:hypothetical protein
MAHLFLWVVLLLLEAVVLKVFKEPKESKVFKEYRENKELVA